MDEETKTKNTATRRVPAAEAVPPRQRLVPCRVLKRFHHDGRDYYPARTVKGPDGPKRLAADQPNLPQPWYRHYQAMGYVEEVN